ncbi:MAG TPA: hypothetical protein VMH83_04605 [Candidatus Acidoferrum sp.]|nr:hypothetical protein [Candidatus Acidoferrum sp.]
MNDQTNQNPNPEIFTPFTPQPPEGQAPLPTQEQPVPQKTKRRQRKVATVNPKAAKPASEPKQRKKRIAPKVRLPQGLSVPLEVALTLSLKEEDAPVVEKLAGILNGANKAQQQRVLQALGKIFA